MFNRTYENMGLCPYTEPYFFIKIFINSFTDGLEIWSLCRGGMIFGWMKDLPVLWSTKELLITILIGTWSLSFLLKTYKRY